MAELWKYLARPVLQPGNEPGPQHPNAMNPYQAELQRRLRNRRPRFPSFARPVWGRPVTPVKPVPVPTQPAPAATGAADLIELLRQLFGGSLPWRGRDVAPVDALQAYLEALRGGY